jgi:hypothetical protein
LSGPHQLRTFARAASTHAIEFDRITADIRAAVEHLTVAGAGGVEAMIRQSACSETSSSERREAISTSILEWRLPGSWRPDTRATIDRTETVAERSPVSTDVPRFEFDRGRVDGHGGC